MIKMLSLSGVDNYQVIYRGRLEAQNLRYLRDTLEEIHDGDRSVRLITRIDQMPSFRDIRSFTEMLKMKACALRVIKKYAILTPKKWIKKSVPLVDRIFPSIDIRVFSPHEAPRAIAWLNERDE